MQAVNAKLERITSTYIHNTTESEKNPSNCRLRPRAYATDAILAVATRQWVHNSTRAPLIVCLAPAKTPDFYAFYDFAPVAAPASRPFAFSFCQTGDRALRLRLFRVDRVRLDSPRRSRRQCSTACWFVSSLCSQQTVLTSFVRCVCEVRR